MAKQIITEKSYENFDNIVADYKKLKNLLSEKGRLISEDRKVDGLGPDSFMLGVYETDKASFLVRDSEKSAVIYLERYIKHGKKSKAVF